VRASVDQLPPFVQDMLSTPPRTGEGVHYWLFRVARQLHAHLPAAEIVNLLESCVANCGRFVPTLRPCLCKSSVSHGGFIWGGVCSCVSITLPAHRKLESSHDVTASKVCVAACVSNRVWLDIRRRSNQRYAAV